LISEDDSYSKYFDVNYVIKGFDTLHPWGSDGYMNWAWKKWLCLECWSINSWKSLELEKLAQKSLLNFLTLQGNIEWTVQTFAQKKSLIFTSIYKNISRNFSFAREFRDFEQVKKWDTIAYDWTQVITAETDGYLLFCYTPQNIWEECFCFA
jgi:hypothetical protein